MPVATLVIILSACGILVTGLLAVLVLRDPIKGLSQVTHRMDDLPKIMAGRYSGFFLLAVGATLYGDLKVICFLFAVFAFVSFFDTWVYAQGGHAYGKHLQAGIASTLVTAIAFYAAFHDTTQTAMASPASGPSLTLFNIGGRA